MGKAVPLCFVYLALARAIRQRSWGQRFAQQLSSERLYVRVFEPFAFTGCYEKLPHGADGIARVTPHDITA